MNSKAAVIIPALNPDKALVEYCCTLLESGIEFIIVVNDGSESSYNEIFREIEDKNQCSVLTHKVNQGKGRALKDAFQYFADDKIFKGYAGVITVDSDGQHSVEDVLRLKEKLCQNKKELILGARDFSLPDIPLKSRFGNRLTCTLFWLLYGANLKDTQTGLRAIPRSVLPFCLELEGERFEYETNMLIAAVEKKIPFHEIGIKTIYLNENKGTHFRPVRDSAAIYGLLFRRFYRYLFSGLSSFALDIVLFRLMLAVFQMGEDAVRITAATVCARVLSSVYNFLVNKNLVFENKGKVSKTLIQYYALCMIQTGISALLVFVCFRGFGISETAAKIVVDTLLFLISYQIQKRYIFRNV